MPGVTPIQVLTTVAGSLVARRRYTNTSDALRGLAISAVRGKTAYYRRRMRQFERKYGMDFRKFTARLKGRATPAEEDDWLAWRSAQGMFADWDQAYRDLRNARNH